MYYVDSNVFVYPVIYDPAFVPRAARAKSFLLEVALGRVEAFTSPLAWDEFVWITRKILGVELSASQGRRFLSFPNLKILPVRGSTVLKAQELVEEYGLKPRDALHAAVALENRITTIVSYDEDFDKVKVIKRVEP